MTDKLTPTSMEDQYDHQLETFKRKNHDYGNSFEKSLDTFGLVAGIVRMNDKFERLVSLNDPSKDAQIASESLVDTLEDLSNYAAMAACWLKGKKAADWKELRMKELDGNIESIIKKADTSVVKSDDLHINSAGGTSSVDIKTGAIKFMPVRGNGKSGMVTLELLNSPMGLILSHIMFVRCKKETKKENDRVMLDMMLSRIEKGEVVRIVANGDGSFTTYFEKAEDKEDDREA